MPTRRLMKNVLAGFLGTYTSRYSDYRGYWLHGQLPFESPRYQFDLLRTPPSDETPVNMAWLLASVRFQEQLARSSLSRDVVREAALVIRREPEQVRGWHANRISDGHIVRFEASAAVDSGHRYVHQRSAFVAPHDPLKEHRRPPDDWWPLPDLRASLSR